jgi:hypothetical protein
MVIHLFPPFVFNSVFGCFILYFSLKKSLFKGFVLLFEEKDQLISLGGIKYTGIGKEKILDFGPMRRIMLLNEPRGVLGLQGDDLTSPKNHIIQQVAFATRQRERDNLHGEEPENLT